MSLDGSKAAKTATTARRQEPPPVLVQPAEAAGFLKALSHEGRLMILCHLLQGERSVTELEQHLGVRQAAVSQQLARLRQEGLVVSRRTGKTIHYAISDTKVERLIALVADMFAKQP